MKRSFRLVGMLEGISFLVLLAVAMPLKYHWEMPGATRIPGALHGGLFLAYIALAHVVADRENWAGRKLFYAYIASILPLGTFVFDRKFLA